jgi:hypothetical protein
MANAQKTVPKKATSSCLVGCLTSLVGGIAGGFLGRIVGFREVHSMESRAHLIHPMHADNAGLLVFSSMFFGLILGILFAHICVKVWLRFVKRPLG